MKVITVSEDVDWLSIVVSVFFSFLMAGMIYMLTCSFMSRHYLEESNRYEDTGMEISSGWSHGRNFNDYYKCLSWRYLDAAYQTTNHEPFDLLWMIDNWNRDFLAEQPECKPTPNDQ